MFLVKKRIIYMVVFAAFAISLGCNGNDSDKVNDVPFGVNLIKNPSFENWSDSIPDGWEVRRIDEVSSAGEKVNRFGKSSVEKKSGNYSCYFEGHDTTAKWVAFVQVVPVIAGHDLIISSDIKASNLRVREPRTAYSNMFVNFLDGNAKRVNDAIRIADAITERNMKTKPWHHDKKKVTVPSGARFAEVGLLSTMAGTIYFDNVEAVLEESPWVEKDTKYITFYSLPGDTFPEGALEEKADMIESYAERIGLKKIDQKIKYYYYATEENYMRINMVKEYYKDIKWGKKEMHTIDPNDILIVTHMLLRTLSSSPMGLEKGFVFYLLSDVRNWDPHREAKEDLLKYKIPALYKVVRKEAIRSDDLSVIMPAWTSFCTYLIEEYGMNKFIKLYKGSDGINDSRSFEKLFNKIYEGEFQKVDMSWRLFVMRYEPEGESTPMP